MEPTNPAQYRAAMAGQIAEPDEVRAGFWSIPVLLPGRTGLKYSFCYAIEDMAGGVHLIDTGFDTDENLRRIEAGLAAGGHTLADVASVTATHLHPDHLGLAHRLRSLTGAPVTLGRREQLAVDTLALGEDIAAAAAVWGVPAERMAEVDDVRVARQSSPDFTADRLLDDGDILNIAGRTVRAVLTPGHTDGHLSFAAEDDGVIITGDHVLPVIFSGLGLGSRLQLDPIGDLLASLEKISAFDDFEAAPGHFYRFRGLAERCDRIAEHHLKRSAEVEAALAKTPNATTWQIASQLSWTAGWPHLAGFILFSALMQTDMHIAYVTGRQ